MNEFYFLHNAAQNILSVSDRIIYIYIYIYISNSVDSYSHLMRPEADTIAYELMRLAPKLWHCILDSFVSIHKTGFFLI